MNLQVLPLAITMMVGPGIIADVVFRRRAERMLPRVRDWMNTHSWLVSIVAYVLFIALILL